jgi:uncharacterized protein YjbJ (UPF0337 family)
MHSYSLRLRAWEIDMNRDQVEGRFRQATGKMKEHWGLFSRDPFIADAGRRDQLFGRIQERRGNSHEEFSRQLRDFMRRNRNWNLLNR